MNQPDAPFARTAQKLGLYPVVDSVLWIERLLKLGVRTIQLRIKDKTDAQVDEQIRTAIALGKHYQARLFINDYWRLAVKHDAYGVHLGQEDLERADLQAIRHAGLRLGISTHDENELQRAKALHPSYIALGHIFSTQTKEMPSSPQGLDNLARQVAATPDFPTVAIGGISCERAPKVLATGVGGIAVVSAITKAPDWQAATRQFLRLTGEYTENPEVSHAQ
ncbi:thiamine phosphate synthase [Morganella psychrotolerans]|uniref:Thiamine-phosphate synthase n=1 Tax=Morganella psychrotolerans TaxID=368603 RepID=A0A1B8HCD8_9GAMM|nr:thiamine phosphate synthase [Morganella psychrotolerans]OBU06748.1 thiamine-phosphate diphosphorylase [Morganella psychrotolerans]